MELVRELEVPRGLGAETWGPSRAFGASLARPTRPNLDRTGLGHLSGSVSLRLGVWGCFWGK